MSTSSAPASKANTRDAHRALRNSGIALGFGLGGFFDGIVLHQLLQWHHLVSNRIPANTIEGLELNTLWDGIFHAAMYIIAIIGLILLWRAVQRQNVWRNGRTLFGSILVGAGAFHIADGLLNHWLLGTHHIREVPDYLAYDIAFFTLGILLALIGGLLLRTRATA